MTRRQFISGSLASAALLARGDVTASVDGFAFPDWAVRQIDDGVRRYFDWKGADETVAFPLITDVHSKVFGLPDPNDWRDPKRCHGANGVPPKDTMMLDLVAVKPAKRQVHVFRFGWGGPESEREYAY